MRCNIYYFNFLIHPNTSLQAEGQWYLAVPHREAVLCVSWVFLHSSETLPVIPSPFEWGHRCRACRSALVFDLPVFFLIHFLTVLNVQSGARAQAGNIFNIFFPIGTSGLLTFVVRAEWTVAGGIVRSHTNKIFFFFFSAKIYLCFLQFRRSAVISYILAMRVLLKKQNFFFIILLQNENLKFWTSVCF